MLFLLLCAGKQPSGLKLSLAVEATFKNGHDSHGHDSHGDDDDHHGEDDDDEDDDVSICTVAWYSLRPVDHKGVDVVELKKSQFSPKNPNTATIVTINITTNPPNPATLIQTWRSSRVFMMSGLTCSGRWLEFHSLAWRHK